MFPFLMLIAVAVACMGMLNSLRSFFLPALAPAAFNVACIASAFVIVPFMPALGWHAMVGLAIGTLLGGVAQVALQWPVLRREGFRFWPQFGFSDPRFREIVRLMIPGTLGLAAAQINQLVNVYLATSEGEGAVTYLGFAFRLMYLPIGLFGVSIATASLPDISRHAATDDLRSIQATVSRALRMMLMLNVPATIGLMVLAEPIVALIYQRRAFTAYDTASTAAALMFYAPGLLGYSAVKIASPTFYSLRDSRTPVIVSVISIAANLAVNLVLVRVLGYRGLALGTASAAILNAVVLLWLLHGRLGGLDGRRVTTAFVKITCASVFMGVAAYFAAAWLGGLPSLHGETGKFVRVSLSIVTALIALAVSARLLRIEEFTDATARVVQRFRR
jgi:putative peptidoglycan lipid II flippase